MFAEPRKVRERENERKREEEERDRGVRAALPAILPCTRKLHALDFFTNAFF